MRILVCGGRRYHNSILIWDILDQIHHKFKITVLINGGAQGADLHARNWARQYADIEIALYYAQWEKYGRSAGYIRNKQMLDQGQPEIVLAFPGGPGTKNMVDIGQKAGVLVFEIDDDGSFTVIPIELEPL